MKWSNIKDLIRELSDRWEELPPEFVGDPKIRWNSGRDIELGPIDIHQNTITYHFKNEVGKHEKREYNIKKFFIYADKLIPPWDRVTIEDRLKDWILFLKLKDKTLTAREIIQCKNAEIRRFLLASFGFENLMKETKAITIDKDEESILIKIPWNKSEEPIMLVKVLDSTTKKTYLLRVPPIIKTCHSAIAWTFGKPSEGYNPLKET